MTYPCDYEKIRKFYEKIQVKGIRPDIIPSQICDASEYYNPPIDVLFIAESPPWSVIDDGDIKKECDCHKDSYVYFYNQKYEKNTRGLASEIFSFLNFPEGTRKQNLSEFCKRHYFLTDSIKCVVKKDRKNIKQISKICATGVLNKEIAVIHPSYLVVLGRTALDALTEIVRKDPQKLIAFNPQNGELYEKLGKINFSHFTKDDQIDLLYFHNILVMPFPNNRTKNRYRELFLHGFELVKKLKIE